MIEKKIKLVYLKIFFISFFSMLIILLPNTINNHGVYLFTGDYYVQQIPFYYHAVDIVNQFGVGWDWYTDLGTDFITSYGFYLLGSVFFWIITLFPRTVIIYVMPVMIALKTAIGALGALTYIKRYIKNDYAAFIGAYMYIFSGYQMVCLLYNHFYDITSVFPFLLLSFDMLAKDGEKMLFAFFTAVTAITNYFFLVGTVFFVIIYYIVKCIKKEFIFTYRSFGLIFLESIIGLGISGIIMIPTYHVIFSSERFSDVLYGMDLISYSDNTIVPKIFQSMFMLPDPLSDATLFLSSDSTHNWASNSLYLPLFTVTGVYTYIVYNRKNWLSVLIKLSFIMALVPGLNSLFSLFNSSYYARWFYMPVLLMCLATARSLESNYDLKSGIKFGLFGILVFSFIGLLPDKSVQIQDEFNALLNKDNSDMLVKLLSRDNISVIFWQSIAFSVIFLMIVYVYNCKKENGNKILQSIISVLIVLNIVTFIIFIDNSVTQTDVDGEMCYNSSVGFTPELDDGVYRISHATEYSFDNSSMIWGYMNAGCFHSIEPNESDDFYYCIQGDRRWMQSKYRENDYPVYGLLSVKYLFNLSTNDDLNVEIKHINTPGFSLYDKQGCYYIYKNDFFIPFGYMYDYCIDRIELDKYLNDNISDKQYQYKKLAMMRALVLSENDIEKYSEYIDVLPDIMLESLNEETYFSDCKDRQSMACSSFEYDYKGFRASISTEEKGLVYFSVPCSDGWTAKVNGDSKEIIKAHYGLSAVAVESGNNEIEFFYETPGLKSGIIISFTSIGVFFIYCIINFALKRKL